MFSDPFGFCWSRLGRLRGPLQAEGTHRVLLFTAQRSRRRSLLIFLLGKSVHHPLLVRAEGVERAQGPWWEDSGLAGQETQPG